jgi:predicted deacylase
MISGVVNANVNKETYFKGTDHPVDVYTIEGKEKGPVVLIIGGIHGDETSTIYAAEEYTTAEINKGTLIVVPRLNAPAIAKDVRFVNHDMNRLFFAKGTEDSYEYEVVGKVKELVEKADLVLNLHEGHGFYARTKTGMGQSVVADSDKVLGLKTKALAAIKMMNHNIKQKKYYFKFNDHETASPRTKHPEQKGSLTYYSVYAAGKPAYAIEISSDIKDSEYRVKLATEAIDAFLKNEGIEN